MFFLSPTAFTSPRDPFDNESSSDDDSEDEDENEDEDEEDTPTTSKKGKGAAKQGKQGRGRKGKQGRVVEIDLGQTAYANARNVGFSSLGGAGILVFSKLTMNSTHLPLRTVL